MTYMSTLLILLLITSPAYSDCMIDSSGSSICGHGPCAKDFHGEIYCAKDRFGSATRDDRGNVVCGLGKCEKDLHGNIYCSSESGGDALRNSLGEIDCFGACKLASADFCERSIAGQ
jgi:hypothetical protein